MARALPTQYNLTTYILIVMSNMTIPQRSRPCSRDEVLAALRTFVRSAEPGAPLPSDARLAAGWRLSPRTVARAMKTLSSEGLVIRIRGRGTFVAPAEDMPPRTEHRRNAASDLAEALRRDIFLGQLAQGEPLPAIKFIRRHFRVAAATVSAAYRMLADDGIVSRVGQTYFVGRLADIVNRTNAGDIVVYLFSGAARERALFSRSYGTAFHRMEDLLARNGYTVHYRPAQALADDCLRWRHGGFPRGLVLTTVGPSEYRHISGLIAQVRRHRTSTDLPIVCDWSGGVLREARRAMTLIYGAGQELAKHMARFLIGKGWSRATFVLDSAHFRHTGRYCNLWDFLTMRAELLHLRPDFAWRLIVVRTTERQAWDTLGLELPESSLRQALGVYGPVSLGAFSDEVQSVGTLADGLAEHVRAGGCLVFQRDEYAAEALTWARDHRMRIPGDIAVLSTDDKPRYYHLGLSRLEVDWDGLGILMAHCLMHPGRVPRTPSGVPPSPVRTIEKQTT